MGLPVQGVPIAFGVLGAKNANATVTLSDAYTVGRDETELFKAAKKWVGQRTNLVEFTPRYVRTKGSGHYVVSYNYLRVITRVYYARTVSISLANKSVSGGNLTAGIPTSADLLKQSDDYGKLLDRLNAGLTNGVLTTIISTNGAVSAGGSLKFSSLINQTVSMNETFERPLVIGYLAFDVPIGFEGELGDRPLSTQVRLDRGAPNADDKQVRRWVEESPTAKNRLIRWAGKDDSEVRNWLKESGFPDLIEDGGKDGKGPKGLYTYLRQPFKWPHLLTVRLISEVIEKPDGIDPVVEMPLDETRARKGEYVWKESSQSFNGTPPSTTAQSYVLTPPEEAKNPLPDSLVTAISSYLSDQEKARDTKTIEAAFHKMLEKWYFTPAREFSIASSVGDMIKVPKDGTPQPIAPAADVFQSLPKTTNSFSTFLSETPLSNGTLKIEAYNLKEEIAWVKDMEKSIKKAPSSLNDPYTFIVQGILRGEMSVSFKRRDQVDYSAPKPLDSKSTRTIIGVRLIRLPVNNK